MKTLAVNNQGGRVTNFGTEKRAPKLTVDVQEKPISEIKTDKSKVLPIVSAAVAIASLGVSVYAIRSGKGKATLEEGAKRAEEIVKRSKEELANEIKTATESLETKVNGVVEKVTKNENAIKNNQTWNNGFLESLDNKINDIASRPTQINSGLVMDRNWTFVDGMRLLQNTDNGGGRKPVSANTITKLREATTKFVDGKNSQNIPTLVAGLGLGASVWLPSAETKPEKEGGLGEVPVQMATNYVKEYNLSDTYIPRPLIEIPGKSEIKMVDNQWKYRYDGLSMDVDKVAEYETVAYHNGIPSRERVEVFMGIDPAGGYKRLMFRNPNYFSADGLYAGSVTAEEPERYTFFSRALYDFIKLVKDPTSIPFAKFEHPTQFNSIKAPDAIVLNDWHVAPLASLMRLLAPLEADNKKLNPAVANSFENMNLMYIVHNADYQGNEYTHRDDLLNTLFGQYAYDIYTNARTGFSEKYEEDGIVRERSIASLRSPLMIDNNVNMANMAMTLSTKVKPVSPTYAKEMAEQSVRGKGLQYISGKRQLTGTMVGQSNGWDRSVNEVSEANLPGFNNNLNKDKFEIFKFRINNIEGISDSDKVKVKDVLAKYDGKINLKNFKLIVEDLGRLDIPKLEETLAQLREGGILTVRKFVAATNDMAPEDLKKARAHNKRLFFEHVKSMIDYNKKVGKEFFNIKEIGNTDLSGIDINNLDEVPFFNMGVRFVDQKGVDIISEAWVRILNDWDNLYPDKPRPFINIGGADNTADGKFRNMIKSAKDRLGEKGKTFVQWDGFVPNNILMAGSDWTMRPSHFEPDGDKWESLYKGTPMVMTRVGGHIDSLKDGYNGFLTARTVPEIEKEVQARGLKGQDYEKAVLEEKIKDYVDALKKSLDAFYNKAENDKMVLNAINGNQSWVIKDKDGKIVSCPSLEHLRDLGFKLEEFPQVATSAYNK